MINHGLQAGMTVEVFDEDMNLKSSLTGDKWIQHEYKIEYIIKDKKGFTVNSWKSPFRTFTGNLLYMLNHCLFNVSNNLSVKLIGGGHPASDVFSADVTAAAADDSLGIVVGLNDNTSGYNAAISYSSNYQNYSLRHQIAHGSTTGTLEYGAVAFESYGTGDSEFVISRTFTNSSGADIIIGEVGLIGDVNNGGTEQVLIARDVAHQPGMVGSVTDIGATVSNTQTLTVRYHFSNEVLSGIFPPSAGYLPKPSEKATYINCNMLGMLRSKLKGAADNVIIETGASANIDFSAARTYDDCLSASGETGYGMLIGWTPNNVADKDNYKLYQQKTTLTHSAHTVQILSTNSNKTFSIGDYGSIPVHANMAGTVRQYSVQAGVSRDFKNDTAAQILVNNPALFAAGTGAGARIELLEGYFPQIALKPLETIRIGLYILAPYYHIRESV